MEDDNIKVESFRDEVERRLNEIEQTVNYLMSKQVPEPSNDGKGDGS